MAQIVNLNGSTQILPVWGERMRCSACWSGCGRFVVVAYHIHPHAMKLTLQGFVYHGVRAQVICRWQSEAGCSRSLSQQDPVVWDSCGRSFHVPSCSLLISFSGRHGDIVVQHLPVLSWDAVPSPGGKLVLSCTRFYIENANYSSGSGPGPWQLFHSDIDMANGASQKLKVVSGHAKWNLQGVAWHPAPQHCLIYAVLNDKGSLIIMNGFAQQQLAYWSWQELSRGAFPTRIYSQKACQAQLMWSPDGTQLAVLAPGFTTMITWITFGQRLGP